MDYLVIDDEPDLRDLLVWVLENRGHQVTAVSSADDVNWQQDPPDVVVIDLMMAGTDGVATAHLARDAWPDARLVGWTGANNGALARFSQAVDYVLRKPSSVERIIEVLEMRP